MLICSCAVISEADIERALLDIMSQPNPPLPTPGVVWRHLTKQMDCCGCAPLAVETIYAKLEELEARGRVCPYRLAEVRGRWRRAEIAAARKPSLGRSVRHARRPAPARAIAAE